MQLTPIIKILSICLCLVILPIKAAEFEKKLVLYNWEEYMPESVLAAFYKESGYKVEQIYYETDELKDELVYSTKGKGIDLIIGSRLSFNQYIQASGILAKIPDDKFPNKSHIDPLWIQNSGKVTEYSAPFLWGTLGIIYRKDLVTSPVTSWKALFEPEDSLKSKIIMLNDARDSMSAALLMLNYSINTTSPKEITEASKVLRKQRPYVRAYRYISLDEHSELIDGSIHMTLGYNGDAMILKESSDSIAYAVPSEGTQLWADFIGVMEASTNKEAAFAFINFINQPERAAFISEELGSASTNKSAEKFMSDEHTQNSLIYPPREILEKSEFLHTLPPRAQSMYNTTFLNISR